MDPITARAALRLDPAAKLTVAQIDAAHHAAVWAHHPSRYVDRAERAASVNWVHWLDAARAVLLAESAGATAEAPASEAPATDWTSPSGWATAVTAGAPAASTTTSFTMPQAAPAPNRNHRGAWIAGIAGACVLLVGLVVGIGFGVVALGERIEDSGGFEAEDSGGFEAEDSSEWPSDSEYYSADEAGYTFPAALEIFYDGRYDAECPSEFELGCWQMDLIPEEDCARGWVDLHFSVGGGAPARSEEREYRFVAGEPTPVVFGDDEVDEAWISSVVCLDLRPADSNSSTQTGQARSFSGSTSPAV